MRDIAIDATLRAAAPHLYERRLSEANPVLIRSTDLREKVRESRGGNLILFAVDASGSMRFGLATLAAAYRDAR